VVEAPCGGAAARRILDVGCGSGALAVTLQLETGAAVWATDISPAAIRVAAGNAAAPGRARGLWCAT
jgi:release factor glutamine methyltransferase